MNQFPVLSDNVDINNVEDGYVIYQHEKDKVHYLNHTAVIVLELCTGKNAVGTIPQIIQESYGLSHLPEKEVFDCLNSLFNEGIIR